MKFIKVCSECGAFVDNKGEWQRLGFWRICRKLYLKSLKKGKNPKIGIYFETCDRCQKGG